MNPTDRPYALVEELRRFSPRTRSASWLAGQFEVSVRTIERDLDALRESGVPVWAEPGRTGGYGLDQDRTLPPLGLSAKDALAVTVALRSIDGTPFKDATASAARKVLAWQLAADNPAAYANDLAMSLNNLSNQPAETGELETPAFTAWQDGLTPLLSAWLLGQRTLGSANCSSSREHQSPAGSCTSPGLSSSAPGRAGAGGHDHACWEPSRSGRLGLWIRGAVRSPRRSCPDRRLRRSG